MCRWDKTTVTHKIEYGVSPTVSLESIVITSEIKSHGGVHVDTIDILGAYLHTDLYEEVIMIPKRRLAEILENIDPKIYRKYVVLE